jgi:hypothetical protein
MVLFNPFWMPATWRGIIVSDALTGLVDPTIAAERGERVLFATKSGSFTPGIFRAEAPA